MLSVVGSVGKLQGVDLQSEILDITRNRIGKWAFERLCLYSIFHGRHGLQVYSKVRMPGKFLKSIIQEILLSISVCKADNSHEGTTFLDHVQM